MRLYRFFCLHLLKKMAASLKIRALSFDDQNHLSVDETFSYSQSIIVSFLKVFGCVLFVSQYLGLKVKAGLNAEPGKIGQIYLF